MNKSALKKFATEARRELLEKVELQARKLGITAESIQEVNVESSDAVFIEGRQLSDTERKQRNKLIARINDIGFNRVMGETAYTWFNRFVALRYMEVNEYLPTKVRVLSSNSDSAEPDMMKEALSLNLNLDKDYVYDLKLNNKTDELFKYLIKMHCNDLNRYMPFMFETIEDYSEILFPEGLLGTDSFISQMINLEFIPEENWKQTEIIGWLYQYYIAEEKDRVFKAKNKYKAEEIPFATQLFTPDWIVQYMVQNSLGRYWTEAHPEHNDLIANWEFFLKHEQENFQEKIAPYVNKELNVEEIKCFDPAMGSGHILLYMFDVLYEIYSKCGYTEREIPRLILENNLYGLDIDDRAYQLASFSMVMKALQYNRRFLRSIEKEGLTLNLAAIQETNSWDDDVISYMVKDYEGTRFAQTRPFFEQYQNAKTFGSLIQVGETDLKYLEERLYEIKESPVSDIFDAEKRDQVITELPLLIKQTKIMSKQYDIVIMNPPYMGAGSMNKELSDFLKKNYPDSKSDLFAAFMEVDYYLKKDGFYAAINQHSWMFLSSFKKMRKKIIQNKFIDTMLHLGPRAFEEIGGEVVQSTAFVLRNIEIPDSNGLYLRLIEKKTAAEKRKSTVNAVQNPSVSYFYSFNQKNLNKIPGNPIAFWLSNTDVFKGEKLGDSFISGGRNKTHNNEKFIRYFWEISKNNKKWISYLNGGEFKKYYGNDIYVVNWSKEAQEIYASHGGLVNSKFWNKKGLTWNLITSAKPGFRIKEESSQYSSGAPTIFNDNYEYDYYVLGFLNSNVAQYLLKTINPTLNTTVNDALSLPNSFHENKLKVNEIVVENVELAKDDWNSFETSRNFLVNPLLDNKYKDSNMLNSFLNWKKDKETRFYKTQTNEEKINQIFIDLLSLHSDLDSKVLEDEITLSKASVEDDIRAFISYAIGCFFGRYSLDKEGIVYDGGDFNEHLYTSFSVNKNNIITILPDAYFEDDIVTKFVEFVRTTFNKEKLEENLEFIAEAIGRKKNETSRESLHRYFLNDFYKDHVKIYKKRPIYWLFTSGKEKAFNCLIYMHRYDKTTLSRIRTDYLHEVQIRLDAEKKDLLDVIEGDLTTKEISNAKKELKSIDKKIDELKAYDELLHHMADMQIEIDLDDGVKVNYEKFKGLVAKI
ncbi:restriction endonuclease [Exiguobacterium undae]|uniref:site-specific DNA-methyltransferase (adenine-specific) n=1 Tax=Exiguobacterium undae TaxID=169177 RepID=A0ABX2V5Z2_9BACL|nr:BREX-1 system adenine-specific DNA-methyltransferase PglX [Exiguobacterium undae]OAN10701.1 restriction endonuclease [Exiguobacterium undae]